MPFKSRYVVVPAALVGLVVAADFGTRAYAQTTVAEKLQTSQRLQSRPDVDITGFPFLTQAVSGHFGEIDATATGVVQDDLRFQTVHAQLKDVTVPRSVVTGGGGVITIGTAVVTGTLTYTDLTALAKANGAPFTVSGVDNGSLRLTYRVDQSFGALGRVTADVSASGTVTDDNGKLKILPVPGSLKAATGQLPSVVAAQVESLLSVTITLPRLPYDARLTGLRIVKADVQVEATANAVVVDSSKPVS